MKTPVFTKTQEPGLISAVQNDYKNNKHAEYIDQLVNEQLKDYSVYLFGGAVRDPIINYWLDKKLQPADYDLLVDDSDYEKDSPDLLLFSLKGITFNKFGSPRWKPRNDVEIDIVPFSSVMLVRNEEADEVSLEVALRSCEVTTGAIAYSLVNSAPKHKTNKKTNKNKPAIYDYGALEAIRKKEIELLYVKGIPLALLLSRLVLHSEKLGFALGPKARKMIIDKYSPSLDERIKALLKYKKMSKKFEYVISSLREIQVKG